jgi:serine phosphatase RsbU (regulator of sigma subunit)
MNKLVKYFFLLIVMLNLFQHLATAQQNKTHGEQSRTIDSLQNILKTAKEDTIKVNTLNLLGKELVASADYEKAMDYYNQGKQLAEKLVYKKGIAISYNNIGIIYMNQGNYPEALKKYFASLKIREEIKDKRGTAYSYNNIGLIYTKQGNYPEALKFLFASLKIKAEIKDKKGIAYSYNTIGIVYINQGNYSEALKNYLASLKIVEEIKDEKGMAASYNNIGVIYDDRENYPEAFKNYFTSLKISETIKDKKGIAGANVNLGAINIKLEKLSEAKKYLNDGLSLSKEMGNKEEIKESYHLLAVLDSIQDNWKEAYEHDKLYNIYKDSLNNEENTKKTVQTQMQYEFDKKEGVTKAEQDKKDTISQQEKQKQKIILILVSCFLLLVAVFAVFMFNRWRITQKQKLIIEKQKEKIVDSITYAQLIQQSILMEESEIQKFLPECFIYFQPKDIVSGDFYWCTKINEKIIIAAVDCTGHGVPGAFMSMIGNTLLNQIVNEKQITMPSEILKLLNQEVIESLHQSKDGALSKDGMAIALCSIDYKNNQLEYAGAENPLYILSHKELTVINADRHGIGSGGLMAKKKDSSATEYTNHIVPIKKDMSIFLFTDGYMDQFGGNERKKFGVQKFKELLLTNQQLSMQQQKEVITKAHQDWKGSTAQVDDILVISVRI